MAIRRCINCEAEFEAPRRRRMACPECGLDPNREVEVTFDDAPAYFLSGDPFAPEPAPAAVRVHSR